MFLCVRKNQVKQIQAQLRTITRFLKFLSDPLFCSSDLLNSSWGFWLWGENKREMGSSVHFFSLKLTSNFEITVLAMEELENSRYLPAL